MERMAVRPRQPGQRTLGRGHPDHRSYCSLVRLARVLIVMVLVSAPADRAVVTGPRGPLYSRLLRIEASDVTRRETVVDRFGEIAPALADETRSLAADDDIGLLAAAFDGEGVDRAVFTTDAPRFANAEGRLRPYRALALGSGSNKDGSFMTIGLALDNAADARDEAHRLSGMLQTGGSRGARRPWHDVLAVQKLETRGRFVIAVLPTILPMLWLQLEREPDTLVWWSPD